MKRVGWASSASAVMLTAKLLVPAQLVLAGCTLLSLDGLQDGDSSDGGSSAVSQGGAPVTSGPSPGSGGASTTTSLSTSSSQNSGGGTSTPSYEGCILGDDPAIYLRMSSQGETEPNLGTLGGVGTYVDGHDTGPSLIAGGDASTTFTSPTGRLELSNAASLFGEYKHFSVEMWLRLPQQISASDVFRYVFGTNRLALAIKPRLVGDGLEEIKFEFVTGSFENRFANFFRDLLDPPQPLIHLVAIYDQSPTTVFDGSGTANDLNLYLNGVLVDGDACCSPVSLSTYDATLQIGTGFTGLIDEVAIYDYSLSQETVARHFAARSNPGVCP